MLAKEMVAEEKVDPRAKRTRELLMRAFGELLAEKSFESITVQEITDRATVNRATFYAHFEDKYALLDESFAEMFKQTIHKKVPPGSAANLQLLIETTCEFLEQLHAHCGPSVRTQFDSLVERQVKQQLYEILLFWLNSPADPRHNLEKAELRATITSWAIYGAALRWSQGERKESAAEFARQALPLIKAGLDVKANGARRGSDR